MCTLVCVGILTYYTVSLHIRAACIMLFPWCVAGKSKDDAMTEYIACVLPSLVFRNH